MLLKPTAPTAKARMQNRGEGKSTISPALIGMSLQQDIPGGLPSGRARFRFSCHAHSGTKDPRCQQKRSELRTVPTSRVSKIDTPHQLECLSITPLQSCPLAFTVSFPTESP
jgi:hypothetical protein